jgi:hypothetical protein
VVPAIVFIDEIDTIGRQRGGGGPLGGGTADPQPSGHCGTPPGWRTYTVVSILFKLITPFVHLSHVGGSASSMTLP